MIGKMINGMAKIQIFLGTVFLLIFFLVVTLQVLFRYIGFSAMWTEDISQYAFIWSAFMGGSAMVYHKQHFAFESFKEMTKEKARHLYDIGVSLVMLVFVGVMAVVGWQPVRMFWSHRWIGIPSFTMGYVWLCVPLAGISCSIYLLYHIYLDAVAIGKGGAEA